MNTIQEYLGTCWAGDATADNIIGTMYAPAIRLNPSGSSAAVAATPNSSSLYQTCRADIAP